MSNKTALLVLNLQNIYTEKDAALWSEEMEERMPIILEGIKTLRDKGVKIIYAFSEADGTEFTYDKELLKRRDPVPMKGSHEAMPDSRLEILPEDVIIKHYASSALFTEESRKVLKEMGIENVISCGTKMQFDVRATATDAKWKGFKSYVSDEMTSSDSRELTEIHLSEMNKYTAKTLKIDEILSRIDEGIF